jgi:hypothetical protein
MTHKSIDTLAATRMLLLTEPTVESLRDVCCANGRVVVSHGHTRLLKPQTGCSWTVRIHRLDSVPHDRLSLRSSEGKHRFRWRPR